MNYFSPEHTAERYAKGRPYFHGLVMKRIKSFLQMRNKVEQALDIACGTGLSTQALMEIAEHVKGTDTSAAMLKFAAQPDIIQYSIAPAEQQPFPDHSFDLITVCSGVHWFDIDAFLAEAGRLLKSDSYLVLYDNFFLSEMKDVPGFYTWFPEKYLNRFPSPVRNSTYNWSNDNLNKKGFTLRGEAVFDNEIEFTKEELMLYFTTQSNISNAVTNGEVSYDEIESWLNVELTPFFTGHRKRTLCYGNKIQYLQKTG